MPSLAVHVPGLAREGPVLEVLLGPWDRSRRRGSGPGSTGPIRVRALIDTGADGNVLRRGLASRLGAVPEGAVRLRTPSSARAAGYRYRLHVTFPNGTGFESMFVEAPLPGFNVDCLIGRGILAQGVLVYLGYSNLFSLSF